MAATAAVGSNAFGLDAELFTRGKPGQADNRGESMVQKHKEKLRQEQEDIAMAKAAALMPDLSAFTHVLALRETNWDVDRAVTLLRHFSTDQGEPLNTLHKKRKRLQEEQERALAAAAASSSSSSGEDSSDSDSDSDSGRDRKKRKHSKSSKKSSRKKGSKDKKKKRKKESRDKDTAKGLTHSSDFGKYGIIRETDFTAKRDEFQMWAMEVKKADIEVMGKFEEKELFRDFMEDYNTGTLPHRKYYNAAAYERAKAAKAAKRGIERAAGKKVAVSLREDEEALRRQRAEERAKLQADRTELALKELKYGDKAKDMRDQELMRQRAALAYKTGDTATAQRIMERLKPDDLRVEEAKKK